MFRDLSVFLPALRLLSPMVSLFKSKIFKLHRGIELPLECIHIFNRCNFFTSLSLSHRVPLHTEYKSIARNLSRWRNENRIIHFSRKVTFISFLCIPRVQECFSLWVSVCERVRVKNKITKLHLSYWIYCRRQRKVNSIDCSPIERWRVPSTPPFPSINKCKLSGEDSTLQLTRENDLPPRLEKFNSSRAKESKKQSYKVSTFCYFVFHSLPVSL